jgi:glycosyltransferase involved in cell wall biosynthesis
MTQRPHDRPGGLGSQETDESRATRLWTGATTLGRRPTPRVSVVIPTKNEALNVGWVLARLPEMVEEVVIVDACSTDGTADVVRSIRPDALIISEARRGKGTALRVGFEAASGHHVVMIDADGSMDPHEIPSFVQMLDDGYDLVKGTRMSNGGGSADFSFIRSLGNRALLETSNGLFAVDWSDLCYGFAAFRRDAIIELELTATGFEIEAQLFLRALRNGLRVGEVASFEAPRRNGASNLNAVRDGWRVLMTILSERSRPRLGAGDPSAEIGATRREAVGFHVEADPELRPLAVGPARK